MKITIRKALPKDAYNYAMCHISCWQSAYRGIVSDEYLDNMSIEGEQRAERYRLAFTDPGDCEYYCVLNEEAMAGFLIINKSQNDDKFFIGEIWAIYLLEEFRGMGYGEDILEFAVNELKRVNPKEIFLWVLEKNSRARRFYERCNFTFDGTKTEKSIWGDH